MSNKSIIVIVFYIICGWIAFDLCLLIMDKLTDIIIIPAKIVIAALILACVLGIIMVRLIRTISMRKEEENNSLNK